MPQFIPCTDFQNFAFDVFGNYRRQLSLALAFSVSGGKCQTILQTPFFVNSPRWDRPSLDPQCFADENTRLVCIRNILPILICARLRIKNSNID